MAYFAAISEHGRLQATFDEAAQGLLAIIAQIIRSILLHLGAC